MSYKRFEPKDILYNTIVAKPEFNFIIHSGSTYLQREKLQSGNFSNNIKHMNNGDLSLYEMNINRPEDSMIYSFIEKKSSRFSFKRISDKDFQDRNQFAYGSVLTQSYPLTASLSRIYIPEGPEFKTFTMNANGEREYTSAHVNKKYIRALRPAIESVSKLGPAFEYGDLGTIAVNMISVPAIFYGTEISKGSIELNYYLTGTLVATAKDIFSDGRLFQVSGDVTGSQVGVAIYNHGLMLLTSSVSLHDTYEDTFYSKDANSSPSWLNFGTGISQVGEKLDHGNPSGSAYLVAYKGLTKTPTLTMFAYSKIGEHNYSHNPTYLSKSIGPAYSQTGSHYIETERTIKKINKSPYADNEDDFENATYISKIGIYDRDKNLIAVASLANPVKKTESREYMFKLKLDM
tara:strand:- start:2790 stop:4001 length:1212 start_codon:yes stop_codon:yes gene_type:complete